MPPCFSNDASLIIIGMRCAGKSSLASIAAKALGWKVVDEKLQFQKATGHSMGEYIDKFGVKAYCAREVAILESVLEENQQCRIIICSSSCIETQAGRDLLQQYLSIVPIVHIMRDRDVLQLHLANKWTGNVAKILRSQEPVYLACSNLTFFNMDDDGSDPAMGTAAGGIFEAVTSPSERPTVRSLSLKRVESDFLRFLGMVYGCSRDTNTSIGDDLSLTNYALQLPFGNLKRFGICLESLACSADILQVRTDTLLREYLGIKQRDQTWWEYLVHQLAFLRRHTTQPILYHAAVLDDDSTAHGFDYFDLVQLGLRVGAEFIAVDLTQDEGRLDMIAQNRGHSKLIGWLHDPDPVKSGGWTGQDRLFWYDKAVGVGCNMVHMTQPAISPSDNNLAQWFAQTMSLRGPLPVSAYNTGRLGRSSQCFNQAITLVNHPDITVGDPDTITVPQAQAALFASFSCEPLNFSVLGANVCYSLAPILHNSAYDLYGMPHRYSINQTDSLHLLDDLTQDDHFGGVGLSSPFKTSVIPKLRSMSAEARVIGAVNTIIPIRHWDGSELSFDASLPQQRNRGGRVMGLYGENTDWRGIKSCALRYLSPANAITSLSTALIIGAGGMARAAIYAMIRSGIKNLCIYNRTHQHAVDLVYHFESQLSKGTSSHPKTTISTLESLEDPWPSDLRFPTVIINCSPVPGYATTLALPTHHGGVGPDPAVSIPDAWLQSPTGGVYMELAYSSIISSSELLRICSVDNKGWIGVAGLEIFIEVAFAQFEFWTGRRAPQYMMKEKLREHLRQMQERVRS
ncbi:hypothetical protein NM208_g2310 [Fusarium decemcellulare]|uniref:Uncharacterized protein n=1 Tax=Fusarium decemcellulare TaxID=57161 RepID=A0ACC1ST98_9HYPO|nr:hypothetical protein NM208_g2310 [Fusarium decemcellulare]